MSAWQVRRCLAVFGQIASKALIQVYEFRAGRPAEAGPGGYRSPKRRLLAQACFQAPGVPAKFPA